jgi:MFS transporter, DHA1 family, inner membrane transport protein
MNPVTLTLAFGNFVIATGALIVTGMLPALAEGLNAPITKTAYLITAFALATCFTAPLLAALTARFERRALLTVVMLLFALSHVAAALVNQLDEMIFVRVLCGVASALYTPQAAATIALLMPPEKRASSIAAVFMGWAVASVVGMPLGAYIGAEVGWRAGYMLVAVASILSALAIYRVLPRGLKTQVAGLEMWRQLLGNVPLMLAILFTAVQATGQFVLFGFMVPAFRAMVSATPGQVSLLLALFGLTGVFGSLVAGKFSDRLGASKVLVLTTGLVMLGMLLWPLAQQAWIWLFFALALWGLGGFAMNSTQQGRLANLAPGLAPVSIALNTSCMYLGQAPGTPIGAAVLEAHTGNEGFRWLGWFGAPFMVAAIALSIFVERLVSRQASAKRPPDKPLT